eukprot:SM000013S26396  [mRNA]  locus=s13:150646:155761:- [translate_table: standard]
MRSTEVATMGDASADKQSPRERARTLQPFAAKPMKREAGACPAATATGANALAKPQRAAEVVHGVFGKIALIRRGDEEDEAALELVRRELDAKYPAGSAAAAGAAESDSTSSGCRGRGMDSESDEGGAVVEAGPQVCWETFLPQRHLKVLLVEDDDSTRHVVCALLRNCNYEVIPASNGQQALELLEDRNNWFDLVLTDVVMPGLSGIALLTKIMQLDISRRLPVIMMSSLDSIDMVLKCLQKGASDFLVKPVRKNELKNLWQHVWRKCNSSSGSGSGSGMSGFMGEDIPQDLPTGEAIVGEDLRKESPQSHSPTPTSSPSPDERPSTSGAAFSLPAAKAAAADGGSGGGHGGFAGATATGAVLNLSTTIAWSYGALVEATCGRRARVVLQLCVAVNNVGILMVYLIIIGDVLSGTVAEVGAGAPPRHTGLLEEWADGPAWWTRRGPVLLATAALVLAPLVAQDRMDSLKFTSALSIALAMVFVAITVAVAVVRLAEGAVDAPHLKPDVSSGAAILQLCSIIPVSAPAQLADRTEAAMTRVSRLSLLLCTAVYLSTALAGYLLFGEATAADVLANFDQDLRIPYSQVIDDVVRLGYAVHVMLVFPLLHFALRENVDDLLFPLARRPLAEARVRFCLLTACCMATVLLGALLVPDIWVAFQFTGATSAVTIGFIFPAVVTLRAVEVKASRPLRGLAWCMLVLAVAVSLTAVSTNVYKLAADELYPQNAPPPRGGGCTWLDVEADWGVYKMA